VARPIVRDRRSPFVVVFCAAGAAFASHAALAAEDDSVPLDEITVTGSRITRDGVTSPTPVTVVNAERLQNLGAPNIGQVLNTLPSFRATSNPQTSNIQPRAAGTTLADLRGLGTSRTLVLLNGRRFVPSTLESAVDLNQIPSLLLDRSEVVTGGASAAYGSDAVAGVVNLILNDKLEGVRSKLQFGRTEEGDGDDYLAAVAGGTKFAGGRGHLSASVEYEKNEGVGDCYTRDWCALEYQDITNPGTPATATTPGTKLAGFPANNILPFSHTVAAVQGGLITGEPTLTTVTPMGPVRTPVPAGLRGTAFLPDGTPTPFQYGTFFPLNSTFMFQGQGDNGFIRAPLLVVPIRRYNAFVATDFDITDGLKSQFELSYGNVRAHGRGAQTRDTSAGSVITISGDNAYLPAAVKTKLTAAGLPLSNLTNFVLGRMGDDFGFTDNVSETEVVRALAGLKGSITDNWTWDAYYQYGETNYDQTVANNRIQQLVAGVPAARGAATRIQLSADAVVNPANGQVVCRSTLTNPNNGCQPVNLFGLNNFSQQAKDYLYGTATQSQEFKQQVAAANVHGDLFNTWAGPVPNAVGAENRSNKVATDADPISATSGFYVFNSSVVKGDVSVTEGYLETIVPLAKDKTALDLLELNGAVRVTDYNTVGNVTTWKYGIVYEPVQWLRLRATRSRDIRAPNTDELFRPQTTAFQTLNGNLTPTVSGGNKNLVPESADTITAGFTVQGSGMFDGFRGSVDYYDIDVDNVIASLTAQVIVSRCAQFTTYCDQVDFNGTTVAQVRVPFQNLNRLQTKGIDFELNYGHTAGPGRLDFSLLATRLMHLATTDDTGNTIDRAGVTGNNVSGGGAGLPKWQINSLVTYAGGPLTLSLEGRFIDDGLFDATLIGPEQKGYDVDLTNSVNTNHVASAVYVNLGARYKLPSAAEQNLELFVGVQNLLDRDPPVAPSNQGATNNILFDPLGRSYRLGVRMEF
jgi:outer membrane receptor protein involved in Fe transport